MHEYPATLRIVEIACAEAAAHGSRIVQTIHLVVGDDAGYVGETIALYFDLIAAGTACATARLDIRRIKPQLQCPACQRHFVRRPFSFACPDCGTAGHPTAIGKEFYVESVDFFPLPPSQELTAHPSEV